MSKGIEEFFFGLACPAIGIKYFLQSSKARAWMLAPFVFSLIFGTASIVALIWFIFSYWQQMSIWFAEKFSLQSQWMQQSITATAAFFAVFAIIFGFYLVFRIAMSPFLSKVAEEVIRLNGHSTPGADQFLRMMWRGLMRSLLLAALSFPLILMILVPGANILASIAFALILASDVIDYALEAKGLGLRDRIKFLRENVNALAGLAISQAVLNTLPGLGIILLPFSVAGAADLVIRVGRKAGS